MRSALRVSSIALVAAALIAAAGQSDVFAAAKGATALSGKKGDPTPPRRTHRPNPQRPGGSKKLAKQKPAERRSRRPKGP